MHRHAHMCTHAHMHMHKHPRTQPRTHTCTHTRTHTSARAHLLPLSAAGLRAPRPADLHRTWAAVRGAGELGSPYGEEHIIGCPHVHPFTACAFLGFLALVTGSWERWGWQGIQ